MNKCPHSFRWLPFTFLVEFIQSSLWGKRVGSSRSDTQVIRLDADASTELHRVTLLHEFMHCASDILTLKLEEEQIARLCPFLVWELKSGVSEHSVDKALERLDHRLGLELGRARPALSEAILTLASSAPEVVAWIFDLKGRGDVEDDANV